MVPKIAAAIVVMAAVAQGRANPSSPAATANLIAREGLDAVQHQLTATMPAILRQGEREAFNKQLADHSRRPLRAPCAWRFHDCASGARQKQAGEIYTRNQQDKSLLLPTS